MEDNSSSSSCDEKSDFNEHPTRGALADGLMSFLKPKVDSLYDALSAIKETQINLEKELDETFNDLDKIFEGDDTNSADLQKYTDKITEMKHQVTVIESVLQSAHNRLESLTGKIQALQKARKPHFDSFANAERNQ